MSKSLRSVDINEVAAIKVAEPGAVELADDSDISILQELGCALISLTEKIRHYSSQTSVLLPALEKAMRKNAS